MVAVVAFSAAVLLGCGEDVNHVTGGSASVTVPSVSALDDIAGDGDVRTFTVESDGYWSVAALSADGSPATWITVAPESGAGNGDVTLTFAKNPSSTATRAARIRIQLRDESQEVLLPVTQAVASFATGFQPIKHLILFGSNDIANSTSGHANETGTSFLFNNGGSIDLSPGVTISEVCGVSASKYYIGVIKAVGWNAPDAAWTAVIPATDDLSGTLQFAFGMLTNSSSDCPVPKNWKVMWSNDNANWNDIDILYAWNGTTTGPTNSSINADKSVSFELPAAINADAYYHRQAVFTIPADKTIPKGGTLYVRVAKVGNDPVKGSEITPAGILRIAFGFYVTQFEKKSYYTTTLPEGDHVVLAEGFDDCLSGFDYMADVGHLAYVTGSEYEAPAGWEASGVSNSIGYVRFAANGTLTTPALTALGSTPTDITVTFKATVRCSSTDAIDKKAIGVNVVAGDGTVEAQPDTTALFTKRDDCFAWSTLTVRVTGATASTRLQFTNTGQWFLDDIVITK